MAVVYVNIGVTFKWLAAYLARRYLQVGFDFFPSQTVSIHASEDIRTTVILLPCFGGA
jgi:hypothetical protein